MCEIYRTPRKSELPLEGKCTRKNTFWVQGYETNILCCSVHLVAAVRQVTESAMKYRARRYDNGARVTVKEHKNGVWV